MIEANYLPREEILPRKVDSLVVPLILIVGAGIGICLEGMIANSLIAGWIPKESQFTIGIGAIVIGMIFLFLIELGGKG